MEQWNTYLDENKERFLEELLELLRIPSVSADPNFKDDVFEAAEMVKSRLTEAGAENVELINTEGYPIVYGDKIIDPALPTILVYGHYDVQPADPYDLWESPPFEPVIKDDIIHARGSSDDKGQLYMHVKALEMMIKTNSMTCNVKFMFEGEEEVGSSNLGKFVIDNKEKLKSDVVAISDTAIVANDIPSITAGLRGLSYVEVQLTGPNMDLHSGTYGGGVGNPANILCELITSLKDENNHITIPGFYDDVDEISEELRAEMAKVPFSEEQYKKDLNVDALVGEEGYTTAERVSVRPTLDVNGIWSGYTGDGAKTVIPSIASAKISMRLVPSQNSDKITELFVKHFESIVPKTVKVKVTVHHGGEPAVTPTDSPAYVAASKAYEATFGKKPLPQMTGGSIPIVALFEKELGVKSVLMGFGLDSDAIHSPNEHFGLFNYYKGIETIPYFHKYFAEVNN